MTGHRPDKLPDRKTGYDPLNPLRVALRQRMREEVQKWAPDQVITGMALGVDQDFAEVCLDLGLSVWAAVPFVGQEEVWPASSQRAYRALLERIQQTGGSVTEVFPAGYAAYKLLERNKWMVDRSQAVLAVWNGSPGGTAHCVNYAQSKQVDVIRVDPRKFVPSGK